MSDVGSREMGWEMGIRNWERNIRIFFTAENTEKAQRTAEGIQLFFAILCVKTLRFSAVYF
jgi:hypothetical protein